MKEVSVKNDVESWDYQRYVLDFSLPCGHKPVIYTCVICCMNFLDVWDFNTHNSDTHSKLMNGEMKFSTVTKQTHISVCYREKH